MNKLTKIISFIIVITICIVVAYKIGTNRETFVLDTKDLAVKYVYIESIADNLNKKGNNLNLYKEFASYGIAYAPLYTITKEYPYSSKTNTGEIVAVLKYVQGTYKLKGDLLIDVLIIQDKIFENGGLIYINDIKENYMLYK